MKVHAFFAACLSLVCLLSACSSTEIQVNNVAKYDAATFYQNTTYFGSSISADGGSILIGSDETGVFNLFSVDVKTGVINAITESKDSTFPVSWFPNDNRVLFTRDKAGNELYHLYVKSEKDGSITDLTPGEKVRAEFKGFTKDKNHFFVLTNERDEKLMDLYKYDAKTYQRKLVFKNDDAYMVNNIDGQGKHLVLGKVNSNKDSDLYIFELDKKDAVATLITPHDNDAQHYPNTFSADDRYFVYATDSKGEFTEAWQYDLKTKKHSPVMQKNWDVWFVYYSESGRYQISGVNENAKTVVSILDTQTGALLDMPPLPAGDISSVNFSKDETLMSFYLASDTSPSNLYVWKVGDKKLKKLTSALNPAININDLVSSQNVSFKSFDGLDIPSILYKPHGASKNNLSPAIVYVHGGPGGQSRVRYDESIQHLVNHGYAVFAVNNRGSSGYGKTFNHLDDKKHGEDDLMDIVYGKKYLQSLDWIDKDKIAIMGHSYGGYMTVAALTFHPEEFQLGIDIFGVTNWVRTLNSIPPWWEQFKKSLYDEMGDPATDGERHKRISPLFHAEKITKPLMVLQGANDPRVLQVESDEIVAKVKKNNVPVDYIIFADEGHGFSKKVNRIKASEGYLSFLDKHLKGL